MVEVRDGVLQPSQYDWMSIFPLTNCLESMSIESQDMEEEDTGAYLRLLLRQLAGGGIENTHSTDVVFRRTEPTRLYEHQP